MEEKEIMLKVENVSKVYKLGEIGGTTLRETFQRLWAKLRHKEDPTKKIGAKNYNKGERFKALDNISFEIRKGERIGIIGHNGAGKSTLLKLISRVTGPTEGKIYLNGRVASMLEVGTGFNPELTGRENIYMNGAILGMTKKEIDSKMEDIIEFSEVRQFIDTPVKRYSSGMYVKLAFSVAAHLDSEIMIMDEVLAVGDMAFQNKCLSKMKTVSEQSNKTILYVSHNMNTIRQLCNRVIVLRRGVILFDGDVEEGIKHYIGEMDDDSLQVDYFCGDIKRLANFGKTTKINRITLLGKQRAIFEKNEKLRISFDIESNVNVDNAAIQVSFINELNCNLGSSLSESFSIKNGLNTGITLSLDLSFLSYGTYRLQFMLLQISKNDNTFVFDFPKTNVSIRLVDKYSFGFEWNHQYYGYIKLPNFVKE